MKPINNNNHIACLKTISDFVESLTHVFGDKKNANTKALRLYHRLVTTVPVSRTDAVNKHISIFRSYVNKNHDGILEKDLSKFSEDSITFSQSIYINMKYIFSQASESDIDTIFEYLVVIKSYLSPDEKCMEMVRSLSEKTASTNLPDIIKHLSTKISPQDIGDNPTEFIAKFTQSQDFQELIQMTGDLVKGSDMDLNALIGMLQGVLSGSGGLDGLDMSALLSMFSSMNIPDKN